MTTTTIRVDSTTHAELVALGQAQGTSLMQTVSDAAEALRRQRFADQVVGELDTLRSNPDSWRSYLADAESTSVADGIS